MRSTTVNAILLIFVMLLIPNTLFFAIQFSFFGRKLIPLSIILFTLCLLFSFKSSNLIFKVKDKVLFLNLMLFFFVLFIQTFWFFIFYGFVVFIENIKYLMFNYFSVFFVVYVLSSCYFFNSEHTKINLNLVCSLSLKVFLFFSFILLSYAVVQFVVGEPTQLDSWIYSQTKTINIYLYDKFRLTSFFSHANRLGMYLSFLCTLLLSYILHYNKKYIFSFNFLIAVFLLLVSVFVLYCTYTRTSYLIFSFSLLFLTAYFNFKKSNCLFNLLMYAPWVFFFIGGYLFFYQLTEMNMNTGGLISNETIYIRYSGYVYFLSRFSHESLFFLLFGVGGKYFIGDVYDYSGGIEGFFLDNGFLVGLINFGIIGLVLYLYIIWRTWKRLYLIFWGRGWLPMGFLSFFSTIFFANLYNSSFSEMFQYLFLLFLMVNLSKNYVGNICWNQS